MTSWRTLRKQVYARDRGVCQVCHMRVGRLWDAGHLVDRIAGGTDDLDNLVLMCLHCNRTVKPIHHTLREAYEWIDQQHQPVSSEWRPFLEGLLRVEA